MLSHYGEVTALITAVFWTVTAISFETASRRIGSLHLNLLRLGVAFVFLSVFSWFSRGLAFPTDATPHACLWLSVSGIVGFVIGDFTLFQAFIIIGARISLLIMTLAPIVASLVSWLLLGESMSPKSLLGMLMTVSGIALVILVRTPSGSLQNKGRSGLRIALPLKGIVLALIAAAGQGAGLVLSKLGMQSYNAFASSQIRVIAGFVGFALLFTILKKWKELPGSLRDGKAMRWLLLGSFFGPFLGVSFSLIAVQHTHAGIAQTIMSLTPVLIIPPSMMMNREKLKAREIVGALIAVAGVSLFFI